MRLPEKVALITGGSRGIGRAVALAFAREGARVALVGVSDEQALAHVAREVTASGGEALALRADVRQRTEVDTVVRRVLNHWGRIDVLVNNAGILHPSRLEEMSEAQWHDTLAVHLTGTFHCTQAVVPGMKAQGSGKIINVAAPSALRGSFGVAGYAAAKGGIIAFTRNAASELKPYNIQVNCISPVAETRMTEALFAFRRQHLSEPLATFGHARRAEPDAVAPAFVFFACADSDYITGQVLAVDGGLTA
ncbi:MAG: SDR family NAD(P)-dependent oxidoreductase [Thermodesulfobacteriota bacterium]|jgi:NAD(P)-dependent dehydrogenase (short-subunit alcohol dehydrogenase family)